MRDLVESEARIGMRLPDKHRHAILNAADPIHQRCDFLVPDSPFPLLDIIRVNDFLHSADHPDPWPTYLVAFASNGCGDYFAYDRRSEPASIIYIDPDRFVAENLTAIDSLTFDTFPSWYAFKIKTRSA